MGSLKTEAETFEIKFENGKCEYEEYKNDCGELVSIKEKTAPWDQVNVMIDMKLTQVMDVNMKICWQCSNTEAFKECAQAQAKGKNLDDNIKKQCRLE